jgi:hypothetical protein
MTIHYTKNLQKTTPQNKTLYNSKKGGETEPQSIFMKCV